MDTHLDQDRRTGVLGLGIRPSSPHIIGLDKSRTKQIDDIGFCMRRNLRLPT
jgi:hypothetical protein